MFSIFSNPSEFSYSDVYGESDFYQVDKSNQYVLEMPVVGVPKESINVEISGNKLLTVKVDEDVKVMGRVSKYKTSPFYKKFMLHDHLTVTSAAVENGILKIILEKQIPEEEKPQKILLQ